MTARDGRVNRAVIAGAIGGLTRKKQSLAERSGQRCLGSVSPDLAVAVGSLGKRVGLPIVEMGFHQRFLDGTDIYTQQTG